MFKIEIFDYFLILLKKKRLPYGLAVMADFSNKWPKAVHMYTMLFAHMNSALNPLVYAVSNPLFQRGYKNLFNKMAFWKSKTKKQERSTLKTMKGSGNGTLNGTIGIDRNLAETNKGAGNDTIGTDSIPINLIAGEAKGFVDIKIETYNPVDEITNNVTLKTAEGTS